MKTAERIFGFASCLLGLMPLLDPAMAQQMAPVACQSTGADGGETGPITRPLVSPPGNQRVLLCGYALSMAGGATASASIWTGFGTGCTTGSGLNSFLVSGYLIGNAAYGLSGLGYITQPGASVCFVATGPVTYASGVISYSLQ